MLEPAHATLPAEATPVQTTAAEEARAAGTALGGYRTRLLFEYLVEDLFVARPRVKFRMDANRALARTVDSLESLAAWRAGRALPPVPAIASATSLGVSGGRPSRRASRHRRQRARFGLPDRHSSNGNLYAAHDSVWHRAMPSYYGILCLACLTPSVVAEAVLSSKSGRSADLRLAAGAYGALVTPPGQGPVCSRARAAA
jgi:hypothetical protein